MKKYFRALPEFYTLNKNVFKKNLLLFVALLIVFVLFDKRALNVDLLDGYDVDEFYFLRILYARQFYGFNHVDPQKFFSGFYSYGRPFWIINFLFTYLPFTFQKYNAALFVTRFLSSLFAIQGLLIFKETLKRIGYEKPLIVTVFTVSLLMIYFWAIGSWLHPDWMMMYFIMLAFYYYFGIQNDDSRAPVNFLVAIAIAIAIKVQTIQLAPLLILYNFKEFLLLPSFAAFISSIKKCLISVFVILLVFVLLNPYLLHPKGTGLFIESFTKDMISNKTNYWSGHIPSFYEKVNSFTSAYLSGVIVIITLLTVLIFTYKNIKDLKINFEKFSFIISLVVMIFYYSFFVNKIWPHYYIPIAFMILIVFYFTYQSINLNVKTKNIFLCLVLFLQAFNLYSHVDYLKDWLFPERALTANNSYTTKDSFVSFFKKHPDTKNDYIGFTYKLPIPINSSGIDFNKVFQIATVDEPQLKQISRLAPFPPDYLVIQKSIFYNKQNNTNGVDNETVALLDSIKQGKINSFKLVDSNQNFLYIKRIK